MHSFETSQVAQEFAFDYLVKQYSLAKLMVDHDWTALYAVMELVVGGVSCDDPERHRILQARIDQLRAAGWAAINMDHLAKLAARQ